MFLKLYDGYPEPVVLGLRWSIFGFFWKRRKIEAEASFLDLFVKSVKLEKKYEEEMLKVSAVSLRPFLIPFQNSFSSWSSHLRTRQGCLVLKLCKEDKTYLFGFISELRELRSSLTWIDGDFFG